MADRAIADGGQLGAAFDKYRRERRRIWPINERAHSRRRDEASARLHNNRLRFALPVGRLGLLLVRASYGSARRLDIFEKQVVCVTNVRPAIDADIADRVVGAVLPNLRYKIRVREEQTTKSDGNLAGVLGRNAGTDY